MPGFPEKKFQNHIADFLLRVHGHAVLTQDEITDTDFYFAEDHLYAFLEKTQSETLERLEVDYGSDARDEIFKALREEIGRRPLWSIIRSGLSVRGHDFKLYFPKPRSSGSVANDLYLENHITFITELAIQGEQRPDFVFFLNGMPIVTMELKHEGAGQNVHDAVAQYVARDHRDRIFQLPFLHIAADTTDVQVATDPTAEKNFRWFNTGLTNHAQTEGEYPVEFLYREVLSKETLLEAISFYLVHAPAQAGSVDRVARPAFTLFPRYHQRRCVEKVAAKITQHFKDHGNIGRKFLINHSAGSGKTLTMCWMADRLNSLYKPGTQDKVVDMVFVVTDRKSLDKNVGEDLEKFSHLMDKVVFCHRSGHLRRAIERRDQIIVTTQQKFHYVLDKISKDEGLKKLRVAFLIDEAHRSQEGRMARERSQPFRGNEVLRMEEPRLAMVAEEPVIYQIEPDEDEQPAITAASTHTPDEPDAEDAQDKEDPQDQMARVIAEQDLNQLYVAFTATPSPATIQLFGKAFDEYTEAEAIAEDYIVDVAQSIISYKTLYNLHCPIVSLPADDKLYPPGIVAKALKNVAFQDPELIQYKSEVMLRIFEEQVKHLVGGRAKAMIVATSRIAGLEYHRVITEKLKERPGADYKVLYAFSDFVDPRDNKLITERDVNGLNEGELIEERFEEDSYRIMIVASKFQTGFDQPLLAGMFLDKAVADRNAVQTVSRLNRCHNDKDGVVVVDFTNNAKTILKAFNQYRHGAPHEPDEPEPGKCLEILEEILGKGIFGHPEAEEVVDLIKRNQEAELATKVQDCKLKFEAAIADFEERKSFVHLLSKLSKSFHFLSAFFSYEPEVSTFVAFCDYVGPQLIKQGSVSELMKLVRATVVERSAVFENGTVEMPTGQQKPKPRQGGGGGAPPVKKVSVQDMISKIKEQFAISEDEALHIREVSEEKISDASVQQTVTAHRSDLSFLESVFREQLNGDIQEAYAIRQLYEPLADPKYTDKSGIFDIMAVTVIQKSLELDRAS